MLFFLLIFALIISNGVIVQKQGQFNRSTYIGRQQTICINAIFLILILFSHYTSYGVITKENNDLYITFRWWLGQAVVATFLFYSGFGMMEQIKLRGKSYIKTLPRRTVHLYINYAAATVLFIILHAVFHTLPDTMKIVQSFAVWQSIGQSVWYVFVVLAMYIILMVAFLPLVMVRTKSEDKVIWICLILFTVLCLVFNLIMKNSSKADENSWYNTIMVFAAGAWYSQLKKWVEKIVMKNDLLWWISLLVSASMMFWFFIHRKDRLAFYEIWVILFAVCIVVLTMKCSISHPLLEFVGSHMFSVYILQRLPMILLYKLGIMQAHPYYSLILTIISTFILAILFDGLINKLLSAVSKAFEGMRPKKDYGKG